MNYQNCRNDVKILHAVWQGYLCRRCQRWEWRKEMAVHFILGGSGRGKSYYLNHIVAARAQEEKDKTFIMLVPEQATMQVQREIVQISSNRGIMNIEVQSFVRLAYRIFGETGTASLPVLDDMGKTMILHKVLLAKEKELPYFGKNVHKKGYVAQIKSFLSEMMQYGIEEEGLDDMIRAAGSKAALKKKLEDMKTAYRGFRDYLEDHYITSEEVLTVLSGVVPQSKLLKDCVICLDGFTGFTPVQYRLIRELMKVCSDMYLTVIMDEKQSVFRTGEKHELFYLSRKTTVHFMKMIEENGLAEPEIIRVGEDTGKTRFRKSAELDHLEKQLFRFPVKPYKTGERSDRAGGQPESGDIAAGHSTAAGSQSQAETCDIAAGESTIADPQSQAGTRDVSIHVLAQPQQEIAFVAECVKKLRRQGYRYRDIGVVAGDMEIYGTLAKDVFAQAGIPCFIDQKKSILANPFVSMLDALFDMMQYDFRYDTVMRYLRGKYSPLTREETDLLDNYLLASGIRGSRRWSQEWEAAGVFRIREESKAAKLNESINDIRSRVWTAFEEINGSTRTGKHTVEEYAAALVRFMEQEDFYHKLEADVEKFRAEGDSESAKEYEQIYGIVLDVLDRLVELLGTEETGLKEFRELLDTGFSEARVGMIPPGVDQIVVGDLTRTRLNHIKHLFFLGATDANIPSATGSGGVLSSSERSFLAQEDFTLAPTDREKIYTEQFYLYLTLTKPEEHLYLCLCESGNDGKEQKPAYLIDRMQKLYPELTVCVEQRRKDAVHILGQDTGLGYLIQGLRNRFFQDKKWQQIFSYYKEKHEEALQKILAAAFYQPAQSALTKAAADMLYQDMLWGSASRFELYASCAYRYFLQYGLCLKEREERAVAFYDIGNIIHESLELYTKDMIKNHRKWQDISEEERQEKAEEYFTEVTDQYKNGLLQDTFRSRHMMQTMKRVLNRTIKTISNQMGDGEFETIGSELRFEQVHGPLVLRGSVDRIDRLSTEDTDYISIVDYKTGEKEISLSDFYYGLQMQLIIYLQAAVDEATGRRRSLKKEIVPAGIFYFHPKDPMLDGYTTEENREAEIMKSFRMKGLINEADEVLHAVDHRLRPESGSGLAAGVHSGVVPISTKKDGDIAKVSKKYLATEDEFDLLMQYTRDTLEGMSEDIMGGGIGIRPYRKEDDSTSCDYCPYHAVCRFDPRLGQEYRNLKELTDNEVYTNLRSRYPEKE